MKNKNVESKKIVHFLIVILMLLALVFGFVFSAVETNRGIKLGSQYRGSFQAMVGVYDVKSTNEDQNKPNLPNGDSKLGAQILQDKLSPFADGSVNVTIDGVSRLIVSAPRDAYQNNQRLFVNAIQSTGGLYLFGDDNTDVMLNGTLMKKADLPDPSGDNLKDKKATSELLTDVEQVSRSTGVTNRPFLKFKLNQEHFQKMNEGGENQTPIKLKMIVDAPTLLDTLRDYFSFADASDDDELDEYIKSFLEGVITPLQQKITAGSTSPDETAILKDFFRINYWEKNDDGSWTPSGVDSLLSPTSDYVTKAVQNVEDFKTLLFADKNPDHRMEYVTEVAAYTYDSNAVGTEFTEANGRYHQPLKIPGLDANQDTRVNVTFNVLTKYLLSALLLDEKEKPKDESKNPFGIKDFFNQSLFNDFFLYNEIVSGPIAIASDPSKSLPSPNHGLILGSEFYLGTKNYTVAKKAAAQISQTTTGFTFHVFSVSQVDAIISHAMFIVSIVALLIVALAIAIFMLFFYRLMGLFTIIVALTIGGLTLLMNVVFGIVMGPEIIAIMFVLVGLIMDISLVMFEAFKNNIYLEKRPIITSFNISNRETLGLVVDVLLASLLPNIVLFWIGIGFLKNFATILTMGILFTFIFGVIVLRLLIYFISHTSIWKKYPWMLPVDTSLDYDGRFIYHYLILLKQEKLDSYTTQTQLSAKQLLKIKKLEEQIKSLQAKDAIFIEKKNKRKIKQNLRWNKKWEKQLKVYQAKRQKVKTNKHFAYFWTSHYDEKIGYLNYLLKNDQQEDGDSISVINDQLSRIEATTTKTGWITLFVTIFFTILAIIFSFTIGLNYSVNYGKGTQYYIYGTFVRSTYDTMDQGNGEWSGIENKDEQEKVIADLMALAKESKQTVLANHGLDASSPVTEQQKYENEWFALGTYFGYRYLISNNYLQSLDSRISGVNFKNVVYSYGADYSRIDSSSSSYINEPWIAIVTTNNLIPKNNGIKTAMQIFAGLYSGNKSPSEPQENGGVLGMSLEPHTANTQMRQIGITFGIVLLALLVYMLIRFKWTYYVALALGLILTLALTISLIVVFRVPFTIEALAGILGVLGFALVTGMLFLGRGKSIIGSKDEKSLNDYFDHEIELQAQKKHLKLAFKNEIRKMKKTHRQEIKALNAKDDDYKKVKKSLKKTHRQELTKFKNKEKLNLKKQFQEIKVQISLEARKNNFLKVIFANVLRFGVLRTVFLSSFYLVIGIVTAITLHSIGIMGFTLICGVIATTLVMITIVLPVWIQLERRRIRMRYGYKKFVNNLQVTHEEQIISGLND